VLKVKVGENVKGGASVLAAMPAKTQAKSQDGAAN